ncbi:MAG: hypothetical protein WKG00_41710 [Polyangiaceae bacterium]
MSGSAKDRGDGGSERPAPLARAATSMDVMWLDGCPLLVALRADARFAPLRAEVAARAARVSAAYRE